MSEHKSRYYEFGKFRLDAHKLVLLRTGEPVHLTLKVCQLLLVLVENNGQILGKDELMTRVWPDAIVEESNLKNSISTLRKALGDNTKADTYIRTLPKRGYCFVAPVIALPEEDDTYVIEKHRTTEIIVDEVEIESRSIVTQEPQEQIELDLNAMALPAAGQPAVDGFTEALRRLPGREEKSSAQSDDTPSLTSGSVIAKSKPHKYVAIAIAAFLIVVASGIGLSIYRLSNRTSQPSLDFEKMRITKLTNVGNSYSAISPDGKYIAYLTYGMPGDGLWIKQTATDSAIRLLPHIQCWGFTFSQDSNYIYCTLKEEAHPQGALYQVPVLGGQAKLVMENLAGARFSADGKRMVFKRNDKESGKPILITANIDGSDERIIVPANTRYTIMGYDWSPDGKTFALLVANNSVESQITWQVIEIAIDGGQERPITSPQKESISGLCWLPDGSGVIITAVDPASGLVQLWELSYPDGKATRITNDSSIYNHVSITSDGNTILACLTTGIANIGIAGAKELTNLRKITVDGKSYDDLVWTPDGKLLYSDGNSLWMINADGLERRRLLDDQNQNRWPVMTPDGRYIVFSSRRSGNRQVWRMDSDGRNLKQLTSGSDQGYKVKITIDGQWVIYHSWVASGWRVEKIPIEGGTPILLADKAEDAVLSPDGRMLAYLSVDDKKIFVIQLDGGALIKTLAIADYPIYQIQQWTKDGLLCISGTSTQIILVPTDKNRPRQLTDFKTDERIFSFALAPDSKQMALASGTSVTETVMITNFKNH